MKQPNASLRINHTRYFCVVALVCLTLTTCENSSPTKPVEPKDYAVYFTDGSSDCMYYAYHPLNGALDSFQLNRQCAWGLTASADGKLLYVSGYSTTHVFNLETHSLVRDFPQKATVAVSPDNRLIAQQGYPTLKLLSTEDFSVLYEDTIHAWAGTFTPDGKRFYCCAEHLDLLGQFAGDSHVEAIDIAGGYQVTAIDPPDQSEFFDDQVYRLQPSQDESHLYMLRQLGDIGYFEVYDIASGLDVFKDSICPGQGEIITSNDGRYIVYTNPNTLLDRGTEEPVEFNVYDVQNSFATSKLSTADCPALDSAITPFCGLAKTPDGKWLLVGGTMEPTVLVIDMSTMEVVNCFDLPGRNRCWFTCQTGR